MESLNPGIQNFISPGNSDSDLVFDQGLHNKEDNVKERKC